MIITKKVPCFFIVFLDMIKLTYSFEWCLVGMPKYIQKHHGTFMVKCPETSKKTRLYVYLFI